VGILGLGYVGLPLALAFSEAGRHVIAFDTDSRRVARVMRGRSPFRHIPNERVSSALHGKRLRVTSDFRLLRKVKSAIICVPTPLNPQREPDLGHVTAAAVSIAKHCRPGVLIVLESTTYPGTTREVVQPILESRGWKLGKHFSLAYSPEREDPNNPEYDTRRIPKLIGGADAASLERALECYKPVIHTLVPVKSCEVAEAAKLLENVFRSINIALVNELKMVFERMGIDVWDVVAAAATKPFGFMTFRPGPGLGGHCTPVDPFYLTWKAREFDVSTRFIELAGEINRYMPYFVLDRVRLALNTVGRGIRGTRVLVLGVAYKKGVEDTRESPALKIMELLRAEGADVLYHDPFVPRLKPGRVTGGALPRRSTALTPGLITSCDLVVLATDHERVDYDTVRRHASLIVDTRGVWRADGKKVFGA
jgi:UDP-N-acetyl-D-glucosamine dehydrogenase